MVVRLKLIPSAIILEISFIGSHYDLACICHYKENRFQHYWSLVKGSVICMLHVFFIVSLSKLLNK